VHVKNGVSSFPFIPWDELLPLRFRTGCIRMRDQDIFRGLPWSDRSLSGDPAASLEAVGHHAAAKQEQAGTRCLLELTITTLLPIPN